MIEIDKIILGDNQFFGVNHMSQDKGMESYEKFKDLDEIKRTLYYALDNGVHGVFFSTHPAIYKITEMIRTDNKLRNEFSIYVNVPYIIKYVQMLNEMGMYRTVKTVLAGNSFLGNLKQGIQSGVNLLTGDYLGITNRLIDVEMTPFRGLNVRAIFLHNGLADLALGYGMANVIANFDGYIRKKYRVIPAFGTLNLPMFCDLLDKAGVKESLIMTSVNKKGFLMNPGRSECEAAIAKTRHTILAMGTLASGSIKPAEAYEYLFNSTKARNVVVGLSSRKHADETFQILHGYLG